MSPPRIYCCFFSSIRCAGSHIKKPVLSKGLITNFPYNFFYYTCLCRQSWHPWDKFWVWTRKKCQKLKTEYELFCACSYSHDGNVTQRFFHGIICQTARKKLRNFLWRKILFMNEIFSSNPKKRSFIRTRAALNEEIVWRHTASSALSSRAQHHHGIANS